MADIEYRDLVAEFLEEDKIPQEELERLVDKYGAGDTDTKGNLRCPHCRAVDAFSTEEKVYAVALLSSINDDGSLDWLGDTRYGDSETITNDDGHAAIVCRSCLQTYWLDDSERPAKLVPRRAEP